MNAYELIVKAYGRGIQNSRNLYINILGQNQSYRVMEIENLNLNLLDKRGFKRYLSKNALFKVDSVSLTRKILGNHTTLHLTRTER